MQQHASYGARQVGIRQLAYAMLWLVIFAIPVTNSLVFGESLSITQLVGMGSIFIAAIALCVQGSVRRLRAFHYAFGFYVLLTAASYLWSMNQSGTVGQIFRFVQLAGMVWIIWEFARERMQQIGLLKAYVWGAYAAVLSTVFRFLSGSTYATSARYGTAGFNPNDVGGLLVLAIPMAWYLASEEKESVQQWMYQGYIALALPAILLTGSRSALVAAVVALLVIPFSYLRISTARKVATGLVVLIAAYGLAAYIPVETWQRLATTDAEVASGGFGGRGRVWEAGLQLFPERPIFGIGAGAYTQAMIPYLGRRFAAHNVYLNILVELGLVGMTTFVCMAGIVAAPVRKMKGLERTFWLVLLLTLAVVLLPRNWEYRKPLWFIFGLLCAWNASSRERTQEQKHRDQHRLVPQAITHPR